MKIKVYILVVLALALFVMPIAAQAHDGSVQSREYQIKAAFLYNFIKFVDWPKEKMPDNDEPIIIGIVGSNGFVKACELIKDEQVKGKSIIIKQFGDLGELKKPKEENNSKWNQKTEFLKKSHVLFFCDFPKKGNLNQVIEALSGSNVLTVGQTTGFLESGGNINLLVEKKKVQFKINLTTTERNNLKIRSKLLRLAKRVIKEEQG